jgi:hypothetical protein
MRRLFAPAALAAVMLAVLPAVAFADDEDNTVDADGIPLPISTDNPADTTFDLGVDVSGVPHSAVAVKAFLSGLEPETQSAVMGACEHYMQYPNSIKSWDTYAFCASAVRG